MAGSLHLLLLASSVLLGLVTSQNVHCGKKTSKWVEVWGPPGQDGDFWTFRSQRRGKTSYQPDTRCAVKYTAGYNCSEINFWCDQMAVKGRRNGDSCVGSYLQVRAAEDGKKQKFCRGMLANVTTSGPLTVVFRSNRRQASGPGSGGARCYAECSAPGDPADYEESVREDLSGASREAFAEPKRDYHEDWDYWGDSDAMEWGDSEESADRMDAKPEEDDNEDLD